MSQASHVRSERSGLAPSRTQFANNAVALVKQTQKTPIVAINVAVRAGSACDPIEQPGATNLLARVIDRGTTRRSGEEIAEALDDRGISLNILVSRHQLSFVCTCLSEDFEAIFSLIAEIVTSPSLPEAELTTRKGEIITAIRQDADNPFVRAFDNLLSALYGGAHPYGRPIKGTAEAVERLSRESLAALHGQRFAPGELTAVVVGDVDVSHAVEVAERGLGSWRAQAVVPLHVSRPTPVDRRRRLVLPMMNKAQADIAYGFTSIARADAQYYAYWLMNNALGQYAIGGRLGDSIRERQGMAYYVGSSLDANLIEGPLSIRAGVNPANVDRAVASIDEELTRLRRDGLSQKELDDSRQFLIGSMPRALETNAGIANFLQTAEFFGLGLDHDTQLPGLLQAVTLDEANAAAQRTLDPNRATIVIAGPYEEAGIG